MESPAAQNDEASTADAWLDPQRVADRIFIPVATLAQWRHRNEGPPYAKVGRHVRYRSSDVDHWMQSQIVSQPEAS